MDLGGSVEVIEGSLGSGKSAVGHLEAIMHLKSGGVVATNYKFVDDWAYRLAGQDLRVYLKIRNRLDYSIDLYNRAFRIGNAQSMYNISKGMKKLCSPKMQKKREGYGLLVIDEAHHYFNSRTFQDNKSFVEFFANARKLGWRTIIITHSIENIDKQIRSYVDFQTRFRNLQKVKMPLLPFPISPIPVFLSVRRYAGLGPGTGSKFGSDLHILDKLSASLYDTNEVFRADSILNDATNQGLFPVVPSDLITKIESEFKIEKPKRKAVVLEHYIKKYQERVNPKSSYLSQS